ncbi:hypothetical protein KI387_010792, partial [Taxus chinensis]
MIVDAEMFRREEELHKRWFVAKHDLQTYAYNMRIRAKEAIVKGNFPVELLEKIKCSVKTVVQWLKDNACADADELEDKLQQLKIQCGPLM